MSKRLSLVVSILLIVGVFSPLTVNVVQPSDWASIAVTPGVSAFPVETPPGTEFMVNLTVSDVVDLQAWQVKLTWDQKLLDFVGVFLPDDHVFSEWSPIVFAGPVSGLGYSVWGCTYVDIPYSTFNGSGTLCQVKFRILAPSLPLPAVCSLSLTGTGSDTFLLDAVHRDIPFTEEDGLYMYGYPTPPVIMVPSDYPSIQEAIDAASNDSVIIVANGRYFEHVVVNKPLKLFGQDRADTIVDGNGTGVAVTIAADRVLLNGFTLVNGGIGLDASGFRNHITISNNIVISNEWGIQLRANDSILSGNVFGNNEYNYMDSSYRNLIYANSAVNGSFDFHFCAGNVFRHNNFINVYVHEDFALPLDNDWNENYWNGGRPGPHDQDYFPSSNPHGSVPVLWDNRVYEVGLSSSSSMSGIGFDQQTKTLAFYVASAPTGYCNVTVPKRLLNGPWQTVLSYYTQSIPTETAVTENETYTMIYLNYTKAAPPYSDSIRVQIIGTQVVPEFSQTSLLALLMILMGMLVLVLRMAKQDVGPKLREIR